MKLYMHPVSTACRPIRLFIAENGIPCDEELVDIVCLWSHDQDQAQSSQPLDS